nr:PTS system mannose/fructose/sorbose family transporter subunit IID [Enterococcus faecium]
MGFFYFPPSVSFPFFVVTFFVDFFRVACCCFYVLSVRWVRFFFLGALAGVGVRFFFFVFGRILFGFFACFAFGGSVLGPVIFFFGWLVIVWGFMWYMVEFVCAAGCVFTFDFCGGFFLGVFICSSFFGFFVFAFLFQCLVSLFFFAVVFSFVFYRCVYFAFYVLGWGGVCFWVVFVLFDSGLSLFPAKVTRFQGNFVCLFPGFAVLCFAFLCIWFFGNEVFRFVFLLVFFVVFVVGDFFGVFWSFYLWVGRCPCLFFYLFLFIFVYVVVDFGSLTLCWSFVGAFFFLVFGSYRFFADHVGFYWFWVFRWAIWPAVFPTCLCSG